MLFKNLYKLAKLSKTNANINKEFANTLKNQQYNFSRF